MNAGSYPNTSFSDLVKISTAITATIILRQKLLIKQKRYKQFRKNKQTTTSCLMVIEFMRRYHEYS